MENGAGEKVTGTTGFAASTGRTVIVNCLFAGKKTKRKVYAVAGAVEKSEEMEPRICRFSVLSS